MARIAMREGPMVSVNVAELKNRLSKYLAYVKAGEGIVIRDRNLRQAGSFLRRRKQRGRTTAGCSRENASAQIYVDVGDFLKIPTGRLAGSEGIQALLDDRKER